MAAWGGPLGVHERTAVMLADRLHLAVGDSVFCFALEPFALVWSRKVDTATCFGLHISPDRGALISHGEMEIARLSPEGEILWWRSGEDIFTGPFALRPNFIEAEDFEGGTYRFDYETGADAGGVAGCFDA